VNARLDAEGAIVGAVLWRGETALRELPDDLVSRLSSVRLRAALSSALRLDARNVPVDLVSVTADLRSRGELRTAGGAAFLASLLDGPPLNGNLAARIAQLDDLPRPGVSDLPDLTDEANRTDTGAGRALVALHGRDLRYVHGQGYRVWNGRAWASDETGCVMGYAKATASAMLKAAADIGNGAIRAKAVRWALGAHGRYRLQAMIDLAASEPGIAVAADRFDRDPWLLNAINGTLDLRTGELRPHDRGHMITKIVGAVYDAAATCPTWESFLNRIMAGNRDLIAFLHRAIGYALTGRTTEQCLFVLHGGGSNGKSTLINVVLELLGDYARQAPPDAFLSRRADGHPTAIAGLQGRRFVAAVETDEGRRLGEALVKGLTGGDRVSARLLYQDYRDFTPEFKLWLALNHLPTIRGTDHAIWRRVRVIPFTVTIPDSEQDKALPDKLRAELPGILAWAVRGCLAWQREGLGTPPDVSDATARYRQEQDALGRFLDEMYVRQEGAVVPKGPFYSDYAAWCKASGEIPASQRVVSERMTERGLGARRDKHGRYWLGIKPAAPETSG